jgi:NADH-quinone oxidoreductase subunit C
MAETDAFLAAMGDRIGETIWKPKRLYFEVAPADLRAVADHLFHAMGCRLSTATAAETDRGIEVLYHFSHDASGTYFCPRVVLADRARPAVPSITPVVPAAAWIEREMMEFWGIAFEGHPRPERLLTRDHPGGLDRPMRFEARP